MSDKLKTLSQAIRLGATFRGQCTGAYFKDDKSCALGAAYEATTGEVNPPDGTISPILGKRYNASSSLLHFISVWNDREGLTREQIADRLEAQGR
jgi:hypothetical protein